MLKVLKNNNHSIITYFSVPFLLNWKGEGLVWDRKLSRKNFYSKWLWWIGEAVFTQLTANHFASVCITRAIKNVFYFATETSASTQSLYTRGFALLQEIMDFDFSGLASYLHKVLLDFVWRPDFVHTHRLEGDRLKFKLIQSIVHKPFHSWTCFFICILRI